MSMTNFVNPHNWIAGEVITEALLDEISSNLAFLASPPAVRAQRTAAFSHNSSGSYLALGFDGANLVDRHLGTSWHSPSVNNTQFRMPRDGVYLVAGDIQFANAGASPGVAAAFRRLSDSAFRAESEGLYLVNGQSTRVSFAWVLPCAAGEVYELLVRQSSGGTLSIEYSAGLTPLLHIQLLSIS